MWTTSSRIRTRISMFIFNDYNRYTMIASCLLAVYVAMEFNSNEPARIHQIKLLLL